MTSWVYWENTSSVCPRGTRLDPCHAGWHVHNDAVHELSHAQRSPQGCSQQPWMTGENQSIFCLTPVGPILSGRPKKRGTIVVTKTQNTLRFWKLWPDSWKSHHEIFLHWLDYICSPSATMIGMIAPIVGTGLPMVETFVLGNALPWRFQPADICGKPVLLMLI